MPNFKAGEVNMKTALLLSKKPIYMVEDVRGY